MSRLLRKKSLQMLKCPHCQNSDDRLLEFTKFLKGAWLYTCAVCSKNFPVEITDVSERKSDSDSQDTQKEIRGPEQS
jgi:transposase-like protein